MCGKFTQMMGWGEQVTPDAIRAAPEGATETVTPMRFATVIRRGAGGMREAARLRWGLIPPWAEDPNRSPLIHARAETIEEKRSFRDAFLQRRGLVVVKTFNEGKDITPTKTEQHIVAPRDGKPIAIAVIWERWNGKTGVTLESFAMVTVPPNELIATITDRMPAVIPEEAWAKWLGEEPASIAELKALLVPFEGDWTMQKAEKIRTPPPKKPGTPDQSAMF